MVHQIFLKCLYAKPRIGIQGEVEIPFSSLGFAQIKFRSLIFVKIFLHSAYFPGTQVKFIFIKKPKQILVRHLPLQASLPMGMNLRSHVTKRSQITVCVHLERFILNLCVFVINYHLQFTLMFSTLKKSCSILVYCRLLLDELLLNDLKKKAVKTSFPLPSPPLSVFPPKLF